MIITIVLISLGVVAIIAVVSQPKVVHYPKSNAKEIPYKEPEKKYTQPYSVYTNDPNAPED